MTVKKAMLYLLAAVAMVLIALLLLRLTPAWDAMTHAGAYRPVDFATLTLTKKPNQYLVCPPDLCANASAHLESPRFTASAADLRLTFERMVLQEPSVEIVNGEKDSLDLVQRTSMLRWPDWISVSFIALDGGGSTLAIYSRSVYGRKDFGANRARITDWLAKLSTMVD